MSLIHLAPGKTHASMDAERAFLGMLLVAEGYKALNACDLITSDVFHRKAHATLFELLAGMLLREEEVNTFTVCQRIGNGFAEAEVYGGFSYIASLADDVPSTENLDYYAKVLLGHADTRTLLAGQRSISEQLNQGRITCAEARELFAELANTAPASADSEVSSVGDVATSTWPRIKQEAEGLIRRYVPTQIAVLDNSPDFGGLSSEGVTLVIGASGMGKTSFLNRLALGCASLGAQVFLYGTETSRERRTRDLQFSIAGVDARQWASMSSARNQVRARNDLMRSPKRRSPLPFQEGINAGLNRLVYATVELERLPLYVSHSGRTVDQVCARARQLRRAGRLDVMVVDYLQDFVHSRHVPPKTTDQVTYASKMLKNLSSELGIPVVVGAQRSDEKTIKIGLNTKDFSPLYPQMQDVQHSSAAFHDAEEVYGLYRSDYYRDRYPDLCIPGEPGVIELIGRKRRTGRLRTWILDFDGPTKWVGDRDGWSYQR